MILKRVEEAGGRFLPLHRDGDVDVETNQDILVTKCNNPLLRKVSALAFIEDEGPDTTTFV